jgi:hypothetical protein
VEKTKFSGSSSDVDLSGPQFPNLSNVIYLFLWYWGLNSEPTPCATPSVIFL